MTEPWPISNDLKVCEAFFILDKAYLGINDMLLGWTAAIDEAGNNFRMWYSLITVPSDLANLSIRVLENYIVPQ